MLSDKSESFWLTAVNNNSCFACVFFLTSSTMSAHTYQYTYIYVYLSGCTTSLSLALTVMNLWRSRKREGRILVGLEETKKAAPICRPLCISVSVQSHKYLFGLGTKCNLTVFPLTLYSADFPLYMFYHERAWIQTFGHVGVRLPVITAIYCSCAGTVKYTFQQKTFYMSPQENHKCRLHCHGLLGWNTWMKLIDRYSC